MPVATSLILAVWEAEVRRIVVQVSVVNVFKTSSPKQPEQNELEAWQKWKSICFASTKS
jgi:hypothetical protein